MDYKSELIKVYDECIAELFEGEELKAKDKLDFELAREVIIAQMASNNLSDIDKEFVVNNIGLYKRIIKAMLTGNELEMKTAALELLKIKNA